MAKRYGIYFDETGKLVMNPHPDALRKPGTDAHQSVMTAVDPYEVARREDVRRKAKAFVEREANRDHEITPLEAIIEDNEARGNHKLARLLKAVQLAEAAAGGLTTKPITAPAVAPGGKPLYYAVHGSDTGHALKTAVRSGELQNPSFAVHPTVGPRPIPPPEGPFGGSGVVYVARKQDITPGAGDRRVVYVDRDFGSSDRHSFIETVRSYYRQQTGKELTKSEFWKPSKYREPVLNDVIDAAYQAMHEHDIKVGQARGIYARTPAEAATLRATLDKQIEARETPYLFDYNEAKINESVPLSDLSVLIDTKRSFPNYERAVKLGIPMKRPTYPAEVAEAMRGAGARVIEYDGTKPRGLLDALNEANAFFTNDTQQDAKGGDTRADAKGGEDRFSTARNFLATDKVPETIFGIPVVADKGSWTERDIAFFRKHPEAGGYYDLGDGEGEEQVREEPPMQAASKAGKPKPIVKGPIHYGPPPPPSRGKYPGISNNPGNVEKHERRSDKTLFKGEIEGGVRPKRFANFSDPVDGLTAAATVLSRRAAGLATKGLPFTIENYVPGYAPKSENDVEGYIRNLSRYSGFARDEELDPGNVDDMARLLKNVVRFESGVPNSEWFTDDEYRQAALAMQEGAVD